MNDDLFIDFDGNGDQLLRNLGRDYRSLQSHMLTVETAHGQLKLVRARNLDLHSKTWSSLRERRVHEVAFLRLDCAADALQAAIAALQESGKALRSAHLSMLFGRNSVIVQNNLLAVSELAPRSQTSKLCRRSYHKRHQRGVDVPGRHDVQT